MQKPSQFLGFDPAFREGGFAGCLIKDDTKEVIFFKYKQPLEFFKSFDYMLRVHPDLAAGLENAHDQKEFFHRSGSAAEQIKKAMDVGRNQAISEISFQYMQSRHPDGILFSFSPKVKGPKIDLPRFEALAKADGYIVRESPNRIGQDKRDAYQIASLVKYYSKMIDQLGGNHVRL